MYIASSFENLFNLNILFLLVFIYYNTIWIVSFIIVIINSYNVMNNRHNNLH